MGREKVLPDTNTLQRYVDQGLTHDEIAVRITADTGISVSRSAVSVALHRAGIAANATRYRDHLPWRVHMDHIRAYPARMLRLLGRRDTDNGPISDTDTKLLDNWLSMLSREQLVIAYDYDDPTGQGFHYIDQKHKDHDGPIPIRVKQIHMK